MNGAQALIKALQAHDVETVFGYPGGCIMPFYDALLDESCTINHVLCRHEQACALAADGFARASGRPGVCLATSGPGATNLVTGIANAFMDSIPMVVITGQVPRALMGTDAFQELDVLGMSLGITKHSFLVRSADELPGIVHRAFHLATQGRPGPVWIDCPKDVLLEECKAPVCAPRFDRVSPEAAEERPEHTGFDARVSAAQQLLDQAEKPLVYLGGGVVSAGAVPALRTWLKANGLPSVCTLKGIGVAEPDDSLHLGMLGMHGSRAANEAVDACDCLLVIGARFDDRATGRISGFASEARVIHIDIDPAETNKLKRADVVFHCSPERVLERLTIRKDLSAWQKTVRQLGQTKGFRVAANLDDPEKPITGPGFMATLSRLAPKNTRIACDVGQHQMWVAQYFRFALPQHHLSSGGLGTMGYGLPAAIGAQMACPQAVVVNVSGDGSFMMNVQELATIKRYRLPVKLIVMDNQHLGMVRQQQELFYAHRYSEVELKDNPEFTDVARAFGIAALKITRSHQIRRGIETLFAYPGAMLLHVRMDETENVWPIVAPGATNRDMMDASPSCA